MTRSPPCIHNLESRFPRAARYLRSRGFRWLSNDQIWAHVLPLLMDASGKATSRIAVWPGGLASDCMELEIEPAGRMLAVRIWIGEIKSEKRLMTLNQLLESYHFLAEMAASSYESPGLVRISSSPRE
ncbi:MAG: hypothetical protein A4E47_00857 [Methanosaeta sp. PtaU1.Bin028]|nr:MAG: hypothetical protein A4E47_00857 [Methanosaeta sp. PtaU1.Bin028]